MFCRSLWQFSRLLLGDCQGGGIGHLGNFGPLKLTCGACIPGRRFLEVSFSVVGMNMNPDYKKQPLPSLHNVSSARGPPCHVTPCESRKDSCLF